MRRTILWLCMIGCLMVGAHARDLGQWDAVDPALRHWYQALMQPDVPTASCCGEADAYFADEVHVRDGRTYAVITDERPDEPRGRPHVEVGTEIEIPEHKLKWDKGNPTGHGSCSSAGTDTCSATCSPAAPEQCPSYKPVAREQSTVIRRLALAFDPGRS